MSYFAIERNGECWDYIVLQSANGDDDFTDFHEMSYDEMKNSDRLNEFVIETMEAVNKAIGAIDDQTIITLIGDDDVFIWSIIMGPGENDDIKYVLVDWKKDDRSYRYGPKDDSLDD